MGTTRKLLISLASACMVATQAQVTGLWPDSDATWKVYHTEPHGLLIWVTPTQLSIINGLLHTEITYTLGADTLISGQSYTALEQSWDSYFESFQSAAIDTTVNYPPQFGGFIGGFRVVGDQVYFWDIADQSEHLLHDFDLQIGDQLPYSYVHQSSNASVASIDTLIIAGQVHRRYHLQGTGLVGSFLIEGIGSNHGPIQPIGIGFDITDALICFGRESNTFYPDTGSACGPQWGPVTGIYGPNHTYNAMVIPNPMREHAVVMLPHAIEGVVTMLLHNMNGITVQRSIRHLQRTDHVELHRDQLPTGIYLLRWVTENGVTNGARVITE